MQWKVLKDFSHEGWDVFVGPDTAPQKIKKPWRGVRAF